MSKSAKSKKLSLAGKLKPSEKTNGNQTIFAMFKKQQERQTSQETESVYFSKANMDNDDAVIITKVEKSLSGCILYNPNSFNEEDRQSIKTDLKDDKNKQGNTKRLSLSRSKSKDTESKVAIKQQGNLSINETNWKKTYKLRNRKTVPLVIDSVTNNNNVSDDCDDDVEITGTSKVLTQAELLNNVNTPVEKSYGNLKRLSLKRHRHDEDSPEAKVQKRSTVKNRQKLPRKDVDRSTDSKQTPYENADLTTKNVIVNDIEKLEDMELEINVQEITERGSITKARVNEKLMWNTGKKNVKIDKTVNTKDMKTNKEVETKQKTLKKVDELVEDDEDGGGQEGEKLEQSSGEGPYRVPYFLENFRTILTSVLGDDFNVGLFNEQDMVYINKFNSLNEPAQKLYIRIFSRKLSWLPVGRLQYPEISDDIPGLVSQLTTTGLLLSGDKLHDLKIVLGILSAPDIKSLAKSFHLSVTMATKPKLVEMLEKKSQQNSISSMFKGGGQGNMEKTMLERACTYLGQVCRLEDCARAVFMRLLMLFSLYHTNYDEDNNNSGQGQQLFQMLMVNIGRVVYPSYTVDRHRAIFPDRDALIRFETALLYEMDLQTLTEKGKWVDAYELYLKTQLSAEQVLRDENMMTWDAALPDYLRLYTAGSVYTRIRHAGVEILQRRKDYRGAVDLLRSLLDQQLYCTHYRGHWYERLTLNLDAHLKSPLQCLKAVKTALEDPSVRAARRLAVYERGRKICEAPKSKYTDKQKDFEGLFEPLPPTPETTIEGMVLSDAGQMGVKYQFVMEGDTDGVTLCAVEELVLNHYKHHGYPEGLHAEGSIISNLCMLLMWDVVYMPVPDVFYSPYQACPLDITTQEFYTNRQAAIDDRLAWIREATTEELCQEVERVWEVHNGTQCMGLSWDRFTGPDTHKGLVSCMEGHVIAGILERFVKDPRHTRSGFPDLTLWNTDTKQFKICEVKGPTDRLSYKQILWIDYLIKLGVDAEVCYVKAVGSKKLKATSSIYSNGI